MRILPMDKEKSLEEHIAIHPEMTKIELKR